MRHLDDVTEAIIGEAIRIHRDLGPGLLEAVYERILARALFRGGFSVARQRLTAFEYDGMRFENAMRRDLVVENQVLVELKSMDRLAAVHRKQVLTYLRLSGYRVGLLINFGAPTLREGLHRIVNALPAAASPRLRVNQSRMEAEATPNRQNGDP